MAFQDLPGEVKMALYLLCGLVIALGLLALPQKTLQYLGKIPGLSPNWISIWRLPLIWIGVAVYLDVSPFAGYCIIVFALVLDRMDGKIADALDALNDPRYPGKTELGEWLDPFIDKLTFPPFLCVFWYKQFLPAELMVPMLLIEIASTVIRPPVMPDKKGVSYVFGNGENEFTRFLQGKIRSSKSSGPGKIKVLFQCLCLLTCLPLDQKWMDFSLKYPLGLLLLSVIFGIFSVVSRFKVHRSVDRVVDYVSAVFRHGS